MNSSVMSVSGVFTTVENKWNGKYKAVDGSLHVVNTREGSFAYIAIGIVRGKIDGDKFTVDEIDHKEEYCENCDAEERMRELEYNEVLDDEVDIVFLDRKPSFDNFNKGRFISIVKDPSTTIEYSGKTPWLIPAYEKNGIRGAYFKLFDFSWVFLVETNLKLDWGTVLSILYTLGREPIAEALGYNYPLFLADKVAKYYRDREAKVLNLLVQDSYRGFRSLVERHRKGGI